MEQSYGQTKIVGATMQQPKQPRQPRQPEGEQQPEEQGIQVQLLDDYSGTYFESTDDIFAMHNELQDRNLTALNPFQTANTNFEPREYIQDLHFLKSNRELFEKGEGLEKYGQIYNKYSHLKIGENDTNILPYYDVTHLNTIEPELYNLSVQSKTPIIHNEKVIDDDELDYLASLDSSSGGFHTKLAIQGIQYYPQGIQDYISTISKYNGVEKNPRINDYELLRENAKTFNDISTNFNGYNDLWGFRFESNKKMDLQLIDDQDIISWVKNPHNDFNKEDVLFSLYNSDNKKLKDLVQYDKESNTDFIVNKIFESQGKVRKGKWDDIIEEFTSKTEPEV